MTRENNANCTLLLGYINTHSGPSVVRRMPLGLQLISSAAKQCGWDVVGKYWGSELTVPLFEEDLISIKPDVLGLYVDVVNIYTVARLLNRISQKIRPITILGGPEANFNYRQVAEMSPVEIVSRGDGEPVIEELSQGDIRNSDFLHNVKGISYRIGKTIHHNPDRTTNSLPEVLPDRSLLTQEKDILYIITARGCPNNCLFCSESSLKYRPRNVENVIHELSLELENRKPLWIQIVDDTFTAEPNRCIEIIHFLKDSYGGPWSCEVTADTICKNPSLAYELAEAGLTRVQIGIESMNDDTLKLYRKKTTRKMTNQAIKMLVESGVKCVFGNFIVGAPGETREMIHRNIEAAREMIHTYPGRIELSASVLSYNPGAPLFENSKKYGLSFSEESILSSTDLRSAISGTKTLSQYEILGLHEMFCSTISETVAKTLKDIPSGIIHDHLNYHDLGFHTIWGRKLLSQKHIRKYHRMIHFDKSHIDIAVISDNELEECVPQRTQLQVQHSMGGNVILTGLSGEIRECNATASFLYEMASGHLTVKQIAKLIFKRLPPSDKTPIEIIISDTIRFYRKLAKEMQIVGRMANDYSCNKENELI